MADIRFVDDSHKIWVCNLPHEMVDDDVKIQFSQLDEAVGARLLKPGMAVVAYSSQEAAQNAIATFNGTDVLGTIIKVDVWTSSPQGGFGKGGPAKGSGGGMGGKDGSGKGGFDKGGFGKGGWDDGWVKGDGWGKGGKDDGWCKGGWDAGWGKGGMDDGWGKGFGAFGAFGGMGDSWGAPAPAWGSKKANKAAAWGVPAPSISWITLDATSSIVVQGLPAEAPAIIYEKGIEIFSSSAHVLQDIVGDIASTCKIEHDPDWEQFPEVIQAIRAAGGQDNCLAVGICPDAGKWAVGLGGGWQARERAVKLALAVALASDNPQMAAKLAQNYPGFAQLCQAKSGGGGCAGGLGGLGGGLGGEMDNALAGLGGGFAASLMRGSAPGVHLLQMPAQSQLVQEGLPAEGPMLVYTKELKDYFSGAHNILSELVEDVSTVDFRDDTDWIVMPEIGEAIKAAGGEEMPFCVAVDAGKTCWGVGMGGGWKGRLPAAKLSLALALAQAGGQIPQLAQKHPEFGAMCVQAGLIDPPVKRQKM